MIRRTLMWLTIGFGLGTFATMWFGPGFVTWWTTPPGGGMGAMCSEQVRWATTRLVELQLGTGFALGIILVVASFLWARRKKYKQAIVEAKHA
jgi:uncharacterized membrane protein